MKILIEGMTENPGGIESFIIGFFDYIINWHKDTQIDFIERGDAIAYRQYIEMNGGRVFNIPKRNENYFKHCKQIEKIIKTGQYDVVWMHATSLSSVELLKYGKKYGVPCRISHSHASMNMGNKSTSLLHKIHKRKIHCYANEFFACSNVAGQWFFDNTPCQYTIMKNGVDLDRFVYSEEEAKYLKRELNIDNMFVIGHIGRFSEVKNHGRLLDVFEHILKYEKNSVLLMIGDGELKDKIINDAGSRGLEHKIRFLGLRSDIPKLLQIMDCFVLPSISEGLPFVLVEAQASGVPCVVSDSVSREAEITTLVKFLALDEKNDVWAKTILQARREYACQKYHLELQRKGFDCLHVSQEIYSIIERKLQEEECNEVFNK